MTVNSWLFALLVVLSLLIRVVEAVRDYDFMVGNMSSRMSTGYQIRSRQLGEASLTDIF